MYFTSNHDENSWNGTEFERMGANHLPAFVLSATAQNSMPLLYTGQEVSLKKRLRFFEKDTVDWSGPSLASFYRAMFDLKHPQPALANGAWGGAQTALETDGGDRVYAFTRTRGREHGAHGGQLRRRAGEGRLSRIRAARRVHRLVLEGEDDTGRAGKCGHSRARVSGAGALTGYFIRDRAYCTTRSVVLQSCTSDPDP